MAYSTVHAWIPEVLDREEEEGTEPGNSGGYKLILQFRSPQEQ